MISLNQGTQHFSICKHETTGYSLTGNYHNSTSVNKVIAKQVVGTFFSYVNGNKTFWTAEPG